MKQKRLMLVIFLFSRVVLFAQDEIIWAFTDYSPANYLDSSGNPQGFLYETVIEAIENRLNVSLVIEVLPWKRCQLFLEQGKVDMIVTIPTPERLEYSVPLEPPIWIKKRIVYTYRDHPQLEQINNITGLSDIKKNGLSVVSYIGNGWVESSVEGIGIKVYYADSVEEKYLMLGNRRADLIIEEKGIVQPHLNKLNLTKIIVKTNGVGSESPFNILIGTRSPLMEKQAELSLIIQEMWNEGTISAIQQRYGL